MKKLSDFTGEEAIVIYGKITKPMSEILNDKKAMEDLQKDQFGTIGNIMQNHSKAVYEIISAVSGGDFNGSNVGVYFISIFNEYFKEFGDSDFFKTAATE